MLHEPLQIAETVSGEWLEHTSLDLLRRVLVDRIAGTPAVVSSFGAESAVLLHLVSRVDRNVPVLFLDTQMMFAETLEYQLNLSRDLGLTGVRVIEPDVDAVSAKDPKGDLHKTDPDTCCKLRKTKPLNAALKGFDVWINGRKRHQTSQRADIRPLEASFQGPLRMNPLLHWMGEDVKAYFLRHDLPRHPLTEQGYASIGCAPCTAKPAVGGDPRSGRWAGSEKSECGIHIENGVIARQSYVSAGLPGKKEQEN